MGLDLLWEITLGSWVTAALILLARLLFGRWLTARGIRNLFMRGPAPDRRSGPLCFPGRR